MTEYQFKSIHAEFTHSANGDIEKISLTLVDERGEKTVIASTDYSEVHVKPLAENDPFKSFEKYVDQYVPDIALEPLNKGDIVLNPYVNVTLPHSPDPFIEFNAPVYLGHTTYNLLKEELERVRSELTERMQKENERKARDININWNTLHWESVPIASIKANMHCDACGCSDILARQNCECECHFLESERS